MSADFWAPAAIHTSLNATVYDLQPNLNHFSTQVDAGYDTINVMAQRVVTGGKNDGAVNHHILTASG